MLLLLLASLLVMALVWIVSGLTGVRIGEAANPGPAGFGFDDPECDMAGSEFNDPWFDLNIETTGDIPEPGWMQPPIESEASLSAYWFTPLH